MTEGRHIVFLLHGIRTQGEWEQRTASVLESDPLIRARPIRYEFLDVVRFLLPISAFRQGPVRRIVRLIRDELSREPTHLSIVAHSFGTFVVAKILEQESDIRFHRLIFCGSIVQDTFDWGRYGHRLGVDRDGDWQVVNDCGMRDIWPVLAMSITWGYGSSGRFGFGHPRVKDRFFNTSHSGFFAEEAVRNYWLPYLSRGEITSGVLDRPTNPWLVSMLTVFKIRNLVILLLIVVSLGLGLPHIQKVYSRIAGIDGVEVQAQTAECEAALTASAEDEADVLSTYASSIDPAPRVLCQRVLDRFPDDSRANGLFARSLVAEGRIQEAIARFERAAELGDIHSNDVLGHYFLLSRESDRSRGITYLEYAAKRGSADALVSLGKSYEVGTLGSPDYAKAAQYYQAASDTGVTEATYRLAQLYQYGLGVPMNLSKAKDLYRKAAGVGDQKSVEALNALSKQN
jgi:hypothetical protein